jgi:hypothetical protein|tara:strand:+ start:4168 stop:5034 length:867 start_codon:yes stop_codon:yes gene_type:complete
MKRLLVPLAIVLLTVATSSFGDEEKPPTLTLVWPDGTKYIGGVVNGKRNGEGTIYWTDGTKFIGQFKNDLRNGPGSMVLPDGTVHSGYFQNDKLVDPPVEQTTAQRSAVNEQQTATAKSGAQRTTDSTARATTRLQQPEVAADPVATKRDTQLALVETTPQTTQNIPVTLLTDDVRRALTYTIDLWAAAWSTQNTKLYLDLYHEEFRVPSKLKLTRRQWEMYRTSMLTKPKSIDVNVAYDRFEIIRPDTAEIRFRQTYRSNLYRDVTTKVLTLTNTADGWKIMSERTE